MLVVARDLAVTPQLANLYPGQIFADVGILERNAKPTLTQVTGRLSSAERASGGASISPPTLSYFDTYVNSGFTAPGGISPASKAVTCATVSSA